MKAVDLSKLPAYLQGQRWFGAKGVPIKDIALVEQAQIDRPTSAEPSVIAIIEVSYEVGPRERYQLHVRGSGKVLSALDSDDYCRELLRLIQEQRTIPAGSGVLRGETYGRWPRGDGASPSARVRRLSIEQSNTSLVLDDQAILKIIRKIEAGVHPELEIGRFLASRTAFRSVPALLGAIHLEGSTSATLAVLHEYLRAESDGWNFALAHFRERQSPSEKLLEEMSALGKVLGKLHVALASDPTDPSFAPEPIEQEDLQRWSSSIIGELGVTFAEAEKQIPDLAPLRERLVEKARRLGQQTASGKKIRVHGDLHLGQVLRVKGEWMLFDFEGEPARGFNRRREKFTPLKDVAGMLRSLTYAQAALELQGVAAGDRAPGCRRAFLEGYAEATASSDLLPVGETFDAMLAALELERTVYELRYELRSRPDWVPIPVHSLKQMGKAA